MNVTIRGQKCQSDRSYCTFGAQALLKLLTVFETQIDGVIISNDIEHVHKTRVTSRRLRAVLPLFKECLPRKKYKKWLWEIKKVTRLLGDARDLDVQIVFIEKYMNKIDSAAEKAGVDLLLNAHKKRRKSIQPAIICGLEELKATGVLGNLGKLCEKTITDPSNPDFDPQKVLEKSHWHISFKLDNVLALENCVHLENVVLKHHEIRIHAKKLRYTMESFASLYKNKLSEEIEIIKAFQDVIGEMHDCDVWTQYIPKFMKQTDLKNECKQKKKEDSAVAENALLNFLNYIKEKRKEHYLKFVRLWDENKKEGFFVQFRNRINAKFSFNDEDKIKLDLSNPDVKIAVLSDVHANLSALERVIKDAEEREVDVYINAGDSIGFGPCPNETVELLSEKNVLSILGNFDVEVIEGKTKNKGEKNLALKFAREELAQSCERYLHSLPRELRFEAAGKKLFMTHGSPESIEEHIHHDTPVERLKILADEAKSDLIIVGHSHEQFWKQANGTSFVNPGSVGRPSDGNPQAAYAVLSFNPFKVELIRLDYNVNETLNAIRKKGLLESFAQMLLRGETLETIIKEDQTKKDQMVNDCKAIVQICHDISAKYWPDINHFQQVRKLALGFFDGLFKLHHLGMRERCWLECAAVLHDVGLSKSEGGQHKKSAKLILNDTQLPFTSQERSKIASITRYHRKGLPKQTHPNLASFDRATIHKVKVLASLLRLADALDYSHQSVVEVLIVKIGTKKITVECMFKTKSMLEEQAFNKKKDLFEKVFAKKMVLIWKEPLKPLDT
jgi:putative phosphoesterase